MSLLNCFLLEYDDTLKSNYSHSSKNMYCIAGPELRIHLFDELNKSIQHDKVHIVKQLLTFFIYLIGY